MVPCTSYLDLVFGNNSASNQYWNIIIKLLIQAKYRKVFLDSLSDLTVELIQSFLPSANPPIRPQTKKSTEKYGQCLSSEEMELNFDLRERIRKLSLLLEVQHHLGLSFSQKVLSAFQCRPNFFSQEKPFRELLTELGQLKTGCIILPRTKQLFEPFLTHTINRTIDLAAARSVSPLASTGETCSAAILARRMEECVRLATAAYGIANKQHIMRLAKLADAYITCGSLQEANECCQQALDLLTRDKVG